MHPVSTADWVLYRPIEGTLSAQVSRSWGLNLVNVCPNKVSLRGAVLCQSTFFFVLLLDRIFSVRHIIAKVPGMSQKCHVSNRQPEMKPNLGTYLYI